jgi:ABC-type transporter Mla MlaB component
MSSAIPGPLKRLPPLRPGAAMQPVASLLISLRYDGRRYVALFRGALTAATRATLDGVADLLVGESSVLLDLSQLDVVDEGGAAALTALVDSVRGHGVQLRVTDAVAAPVLLSKKRSGNGARST